MRPLGIVAITQSWTCQARLLCDIGWGRPLVVSLPFLLISKVRGLQQSDIEVDYLILTECFRLPESCRSSKKLCQLQFECNTHVPHNSPNAGVTNMEVEWWFHAGCIRWYVEMQEEILELIFLHFPQIKVVFIF